jgi:Na+-driven multidrug efflux pump
MNKVVLSRTETEVRDKISKQSIWENVRDAIQGTEADYTSINLNKAILLLSIPMILELVMESTFAVVDIFFVGKLGASAVAAVGLTETYMFLLYSVAMGLSMAVTAIVARSWS